MRPAVALEVAGALALADRDRAAVRAGRLEHAERDGSTCATGSAPALGATAASAGASSSTPKTLGCWKMTAAASDDAAAELAGSVTPPLVRDLDHLEPEARRVRLHDLPHHRVQRLGDRPPSSGRSRASR